MPFLAPSPVTLLHAQADTTSIPLVAKDVRLTKRITAREVDTTNFREVARWLRSTGAIIAGTTEDELYQAKDFFVFSDVRMGDLMEAYSLLYRMRWVRYRHGTPAYELSLAKDAIDSLYLPQDEFQKRRFQSTAQLVAGIDKMSTNEKAAIFAGKPLNYIDLAPEMKGAIAGAIEAQLDALVATSHGFEKPDIATLKTAQIKIADRSKTNGGLRELWFDVSSNLGSYSFRWNNYDKDRSQTSYTRPVLFTTEPVADELFSRQKMVEKSSKLNTKITLRKTERSLSSLLGELAKTAKVNVIANEDTDKRILSLSFDNQPLWIVMDVVSKEYGDWEWELGPSDFIVMRSSKSPRRRSIPSLPPTTPVSR